jgi:predicted nucleotidyltransferase
MSLVDEAFQGLQTRLEITATEQKTASSRQQRIRAHIDRHWDIDRDFLMGSYARHTKTKPLKDVDIMLVVKRQGDQGKLRDQAPSAVLAELCQVLDEVFDAEINGFGVTVLFGEGDITSFEVVPAFERSGGGFEIPDEERARWIATDPDAHKEASTAKNEACAQKYVPMVKMVKAINRERGEPISPSFLIEVMAQDLVDSPFGRYQDEIVWFLASAGDQITDAWPDPAHVGPAVNELVSTEERQQAAAALKEWLRIAEDAGRLEDDGKERDAVARWRELFGTRMPNS